MQCRGLNPDGVSGLALSLFELQIEGHWMDEYGILAVFCNASPCTSTTTGCNACLSAGVIRSPKRFTLTIDTPTPSFFCSQKYTLPSPYLRQYHWAPGTAMAFLLLFFIFYSFYFMFQFSQNTKQNNHTTTKKMLLLWFNCSSHLSFFS